MVGITLTAEQIRAAPPEVRHWIEHQVAAMFAPPAAEMPHASPHQLAQCTPGETQAVLEQIDDLLPVVSVFFELGREGASVPVQGLRAFRISEILRHTRLETTEQVLEALELINQALRRVRGDPEAMICGFDREGRCYVTEATSRAVLSLWRGIVAGHAPGAQPATSAAAPPGPAPTQPYRMPAYSVSMPGIVPEAAPTPPVNPLSQTP